VEDGERAHHEEEGQEVCDSQVLDEEDSDVIYVVRDVDVGDGAE